MGDKIDFEAFRRDQLKRYIASVENQESLGEVILDIHDRLCDLEEWAEEVEKRFDITPGGEADYSGMY